jgi:uncharacterized damage-inducible protein DinB
MNVETLIDRYSKGPEILSYAAQGLTPEQLKARPGPGEWSVTELVVHMLDSDLVVADRMKRVIAEESPTLLAYDECAFNKRLAAQDQPVDEALAFFAANRKWMARLLRACSDSDFARAGTHTERGRETLADMVAIYTAHLDHHLKFLYAKRANLGVALYPRYCAD